MARTPAEPPERRVRRLVGLRGAAARLGGARLCFGKPVREGKVTVVPVASVRAAGGFGLGTGAAGSTDSGDGAGGGGWVEGRPFGFIEIGPDGARFEAIPDPEATVRAARSALTTLFGVALAITRIRAARRRSAVPASAARRLLGR